MGDNLLEVCLDAVLDGSSTCDDFLDEDCTMESSPEGDILPGEIDSPTTCSNLCAIEEFPFFVFNLEENICQCFSSLARTCSGVAGPPEPALDGCTGDS